MTAPAGATKADAIVEKIAGASGGRVRAVPLRLDGLRLVEGSSSAASAGAASHDDDPWRQMFASALMPDADLAAAASWRSTLEDALRSSGRGGGGGGGAGGRRVSRAVGCDGPRLGQATVAIDPAQLREGYKNHSDTAGAGADAAARNPIDAVATFLSTLSPALCQGLMQEVIATPAVPEPVVQALAQRLSPGVVLGALAAVDQSSGTASSAALALLRKMSANIPSASAAGTLGAVAAAGSRADVDDIAATLESLLRTDREQQFVPAEYLQRRQELSAHALSSAAAEAGGQGRSAANGASGGATNSSGGSTGSSIGVAARPLYPDDAETARHAANLALDILTEAAADPNANPAAPS